LAQVKVPPFVFTTFTFFRDRELQAKAKQFGALAVLDKPLDIGDLREIVNRSLHHLTGDRDSLSHVPLAEMEHIPESLWR
jgi:AmiR/NasT family two-component response regulator